MELWLKAMFIPYEEDFEYFCLQKYYRIQFACELLGITNDESFEDFVERNYDSLYKDYMNSMDRTIH